MNYGIFQQLFYTFSQMLRSPYMRFSNLSCMDGHWKQIHSIYFHAPK
ncbi:hypothetical protein LEP1GSC172_0728 [Leptospira noguchii]|uniref:Uncharacterized protein n=2 Tax=Leptospira noguchii TaxID=28182 RepID=T0GT87_9LEPT|nr:hypothetical protein LEP1GSC172_0728 [Leptospira noguchii]EQA70591.1 hypothetical protein LEP1GSC059_4604 [Leptospira noguchii serovar Panama str. CZ214]